MSRVVPLRYLLRERDSRGAGEREVLSVYRDHGVVRKGSRTDNFNKTPQDLSMYKQVERDDLVVNKMKAWQGSLGVSPYVGAVSGDYLVADVVDPQVEPRYLHQLLRSAHLIDEYGKRSTGIRPTQWRLYWDDFGDIRVRVPTLPVQRAIADYLDAETARIDALIAKKQQLIHLLEERVDATVFAGVTGWLTSQGAERKASGVDWIGAIPLHYRTPTLGAHYRSQLGKMLNADAAVGQDQAPYLKNTNVKWDRFDMDDLPTMSFDLEDRARCGLMSGDLLVCEGGEVGRSAVWDIDDSGIFFQKALHRVRPISEGNTRFLMYCLWAASKLDVFAVEGNQATIVHLTGEKLMEHRFPFPPLVEQGQIVDVIDERRQQLDAVCASVEQQIGLLVEHRQALITAAVTGEFTVPGAA